MSPKVLQALRGVAPVAGLVAVLGGCGVIGPGAQARASYRPPRVALPASFFNSGGVSAPIAPNPMQYQIDSERNRQDQYRREALQPAWCRTSPTGCR